MSIFYDLLTKWAPSLSHGTWRLLHHSGQWRYASGWQIGEFWQRQSPTGRPLPDASMWCRCDGGCKMSRSGSCLYISLTSDPKTCFMKSSSLKLIRSQIWEIMSILEESFPKKMWLFYLHPLSSWVVNFGSPNGPGSWKRRILDSWDVIQPQVSQNKSLQILRVTHKCTTRVPHLNTKDLEGMFFFKDIPDHSREVLKKVGKNHRSSSGFHPFARTNLCSQHGFFVGKWGSLRASVPMEAAGIGPGGLNNSGPALMMPPSRVTQWSLVTGGVAPDISGSAPVSAPSAWGAIIRGFESWENAGNHRGSLMRELHEW